MANIVRAVEAILGRSLSRPIPVTSAEYILLFFISYTGISAKEKTTMPSPPIHWETLRQNFSVCDMLSMSLKTVAPVVVKPLIVSKNALATSRCKRCMKGMQPMTENIIQERETIKKLSARDIRTFLFFCPLNFKDNPNMKQTQVVHKKTFQSSSLKSRAMRVESRRKLLSIRMSNPNILFFTSYRKRVLDSQWYSEDHGFPFVQWLVV